MLVYSKAHKYEFMGMMGGVIVIDHGQWCLLGLCAVVVYSQLTLTLTVSDGTIVRVITGAFCR